MLMQESGYEVAALNKDCGLPLEEVYHIKTTLRPRDVASLSKSCVVHDIGIAQINFKTAATYKFNVKKLITDQEYSILAGAKVLSWFKQNYAKNDKDWWTRFNCGTKQSTTRKTCQTYKKLVVRYL